MKSCPHCGQPIPPRLSLPPIQRRIYEFIRRNPGRTRREITDFVYADDPNGGPQSDNIVSVQVYHINKALEPHGLRIRRFRVQRADGYDADDDMTKSIEHAYATIRERVSRGGPGWTPPEVTS